AASEPEQQQFDAAMRNDRSEALGGQRGRWPWQCSIPEDQHRALINHAADAETARPIALDDLAAGRVDRSQLHGSSMAVSAMRAPPGRRRYRPCGRSRAG